VDPAGNVYVVDSENNRIQKFDRTGELLQVIGGNGPGDDGHGFDPGQFHDPYGIALDAQGFIYVTDTANQRVQKLDPEGSVVATWGGQGSAAGQFDRPLGIALNSAAGTLYVADRQNGRIQMFDLDGQFLGQLASRDTLTALAVDGLGRLFVSFAETSDTNMQRLDMDGDFIVVRGGRAFGEFAFQGPAGIAIRP
jgi:DNA-binding beta-propeller fold protein YncE